MCFGDFSMSFDWNCPLTPGVFNWEGKQLLSTMYLCEQRRNWSCKLFIISNYCFVGCSQTESERATTGERFKQIASNCKETARRATNLGGQCVEFVGWTARKGRRNCTDWGTELAVSSYNIHLILLPFLRPFSMWKIRNWGKNYR